MSRLVDAAANFEPVTADEAWALFSGMVLPPGKQEDVFITDEFCFGVREDLLYVWAVGTDLPANWPVHLYRWCAATSSWVGTGVHIVHATSCSTTYDAR